MTAVTVSMVSFIFAITSAMSNGSRLWMVPCVRHDRRVLGAGVDLHELVADQPVVLDRGDRVEAQQLVQIAAHPHPDAEPSGRRGRHVDRLDLAGVHARDPDLGAVVERGDLRELGDELEGVAEQHAPAADQEQADG